jgi:hypothetical protein
VSPERRPSLPQRLRAKTLGRSTLSDVRLGARAPAAKIVRGAVEQRSTFERVGAVLGCSDTLVRGWGDADSHHEMTVRDVLALAKGQPLVAIQIARDVLLFVSGLVKAPGLDPDEHVDRLHGATCAAFVRRTETGNVGLDELAQLVAQVRGLCDEAQAEIDALRKTGTR